jgi:hypothetical protein
MAIKTASFKIPIDDVSLSHLSCYRDDDVVVQPISFLLGRKVFPFICPFDLENTLKTLFQKHTGIKSEYAFSKVWSIAMQEAQCDLSCASAVPCATLKKIDSILKKMIYYEGRGMLSSEGVQQRSVMRKILRRLVKTGAVSQSFYDLNNIRFVQKMGKKKLNDLVCHELKEMLQECLLQLPQKGSEEEKIFRVFLGHIISLIPYSYPQKGDVFVIPVETEHDWVASEYTIDKEIHISYENIDTPIPIYGLLSSSARPILACIGTTYPTAQGHVETVLADFTPGCSVGQAPFEGGKREIASWLDDKQNVDVYGMSLGGALSLHILKDFSVHLHSVNAYNPPALYPEQWTQKYDHGVKINIFTQHGDFVSDLGTFPEGKRVDIFHQIMERRGIELDPISPHTDIYSGGDFLTMVKLSAEKENMRKKRSFLTILHKNFSWIVYSFVKNVFHFFKTLNIFCGCSSSS